MQGTTRTSNSKFQKLPKSISRGGCQARSKPSEKDAGGLCLSCGLCCNGAIFSDVSLEREERREHFAQRGLRFANSPDKFVQPCTAFSSGLCSIYHERPGHCRKFECHLLLDLKSGAVNHAEARQVVREALAALATTTRLLRELGDHQEHLPVRTRFAQLTARFEHCPPTARGLELFADLTCAVHQLVVLLSTRFYSGE